MESTDLLRYSQAIQISQFFSGMPSDAIQGLIESGSKVETASGKPIVVENGWVPGLFIVLEGSAQVMKGGAPIHELVKGAFFGEMSLFGIAQGASATIQANEKTTCLLINKVALETWGKQFQEAEKLFLYRMCTELSRRLFSTSQKIT